MKKIGLVATFLAGFITSHLQAQVLPELLIGKLPVPPGSVCSDDTTAHNTFTNNCENFNRILDDEMQRRHRKMDETVAREEDKIAEHAMMRTGVSPELTRQMMALQQQRDQANSQAQRNQIDAQMEALTGQMIQQSTNISMEEIDNLKKMDKAGKEAWATAYATETQAEVMADPESFQKKNEENMHSFNLVQKKQQLSDSLNACNSKYFKMFQDLENDSKALAILDEIKQKRERIQEFYKQGESQEKIIQIQHQIVNLEEQYCNMQTSGYLRILNQFFVFTKSSIKPFYTLEKLTNEVNATQTGSDLGMEKGELGLIQIQAYFSKLQQVYKYNIIEPRMEIIGAE